MKDTIYRQAAIDAIEEMQKPIMRSIFEYEQYIFTGMSEALNAIKELPSAQPEPQWIPCSERLPEAGTEAILHYSNGKKSGGVYLGNRTWDVDFGDKDFRTKVIAWMPLPEPYKEDE